MFQTEKLKLYLNNFNGQGEEDKAELKLDFYLTPITYELAQEVSPQLADCLFFRAGNDQWNPRSVMPKSSFALGEIPEQRAQFFPAADDKVERFGVLVENARVSSITAVRAYPDKLDFRLQFHLSVDMNDSTMTLCKRFYKKEIFVTMSPMQPTLFDKGQVAPGQLERCEQCNEPAAYVDSEKSFLCQKHVRKGKGEVTLIVRKETPKEAEERAMREKATPETPVEDIRDENITSAEEINRRASKKASRRVH